LLEKALNILCYNEAMEINSKRLEYQIQNLMQLRNNCIGYVPIVLTGTLGLLFLALSY